MDSCRPACQDRQGYRHAYQELDKVAALLNLYMRGRAMSCKGVPGPRAGLCMGECSTFCGKCILSSSLRYNVWPTCLRTRIPRGENRVWQGALTPASLAHPDVLFLSGRVQCFKAIELIHVQALEQSKTQG